MAEKYDLAQMLAEIKEDEKLIGSQNRQMTQEEIQLMVQRVAKKRRRGKHRSERDA